MSCSACKSKGHNIRTCPNKLPATSEGITTSQASASSKRSGKQKSHPTQAVQQSQSSEPSQAIVQSDSGKSISRVIKSGAQEKLISSAIVTGDLGYAPSIIVTGDLGYAPSKGLKWKGKSAITERQLQHKSALLRQKNIKSQTSSQGAARTEGV
uniref:Uncharacterized protein n=1 Tax=Solanum tuberosum TaxID=4113 RepID=M1B951_SOLTU